VLVAEREARQRGQGIGRAAVFGAVVINLDGGNLRTALIRLRTRVPALEP
jgi:hypothetical protein